MCKGTLVQIDKIKSFEDRLSDASDGNGQNGDGVEYITYSKSFPKYCKEINCKVNVLWTLSRRRVVAMDIFHGIQKVKWEPIFSELQIMNYCCSCSVDSRDQIREQKVELNKGTEGDCIVH